MNTDRDDRNTLDGLVRVLVVDDSRQVRESLCRVLEATGRFTVVGFAENGLSGVQLAAQLRPDVVLMDLQMPGMDGLEATRHIKARTPAPKVFLVTLHDTAASRAAAKAAGADGFFSKAEISRTLRPLLGALEGEPKDGQGRSDRAKPPDTSVEGSPRAGRREETHGGCRSVLTPREGQILRLIAEGRSSKEVAHRLRISVATVDTHRSNLMRKLNLHSVGKLVRYAIRNRLVEP